MQNEYQMPTQTFKFEVTFTYEVQAYNVLQAYKLIDHLNVTSAVLSSTTFPIGRKSIKDIQKTIKYTGLRDFNERPDYHSNLWGSCSVEAKLIDNSDNWHKPHTRIKYLGVA